MMMKTMQTRKELGSIDAELDALDEREVAATGPVTESERQFMTELFDFDALRASVRSLKPLLTMT
ncbi:hypothetical protein PsorP6_000511 [Peronosclerospora sorghi]|uniref:Uncharacterized protein n=1 Tax=Peronosclerospora sorghi TaxID=230839 RepID=A0ACC0WTE7_9STRA|nr:hypothetical protein PsorP6_000511 [Peronosclerospora sorghi]